MPLTNTDRQTQRIAWQNISNYRENYGFGRDLHIHSDLENSEIIRRRTAANSIGRVVDLKSATFPGSYSVRTVTGKQSLTPEQLAESRKKVIDEKIAALAEQYNIQKGVKLFLHKNAYLLPVLEELPNKVAEYFGNERELLLKVSGESVFLDSSELSLFISVPLTADEGLDILDKFDNEWWLDNLERTKYNLNINLKFV